MATPDLPTTVFDAEGFWNQEFWVSERFTAFRNHVREMFAAFDGDIRHLSHAMQGEVTMVEAATIGQQRRSRPQFRDLVAATKAAREAE